MLNLKKVAITGGISCGKTELSRFLQELGAYYVSADDIVHQLLSSPNTKLGRQIVDLLGSEIVIHNQIDRKMVAEKVFAKRELLDKLEKIIHPEVFYEIEKEYETALKKGACKLFIAEIPLLFETGGEKYFDKTVAVIRDEELIQKSADTALRMQRQLSQEQKAEKADTVITNNGSKEELKRKAKELFENLTKNQF